MSRRLLPLAGFVAVLLGWSLFAPDRPCCAAPTETGFLMPNG